MLSSRERGRQSPPGKVLLNRRLSVALFCWASFGAYSVWFAAHLIPNLALRLQFEDQLIVLRYARNLAEGNGLIYNLGERVMGFTTPLFTLLSGLFVALGGDQAPAWQNTFGLFCMLGTAAIGAHATISYLLRTVLAAARRFRPTPQGAAHRSVRGVAALALLAVAFPVLRSTYAQAHYRVEPNPRSEGLAGMGKALGERFDGATSVLVDEIGHIGWWSSVRIIDQAGLVTPGLRYDVPRHLVVERHRPDLLLLHSDAPARHGVRQTAAFPRSLGYRRVPDFPAAPGYRLWEFSGGDIANSSQAGSLYELQRNETGHVEALIESGPATAGPSRRFPIAGRGDATIGYLDSAGLESSPLPNSNASSVVLTGWAADTTNPTSLVEVVVVLGERVVASAIVDLARPDVAAQYGRPFEYSGFSLLLAEDPERILREGFVGYALSSRGLATRLRFLYQPLATEPAGLETLPISDGRRLTVQGPGSGFDGSVDLVTREGDRTVIGGWGADLARGELPRQIVVYRDGEFLVSLGANRQRPDIAAAHGDERLLRTGFRGTVPGAPEPATFSDRHRVFAVMLRGVAVELPVSQPEGPATQR